jgi:hypothetical protein
MKMMNKFLMIALVLSVFFGCKKDDEDKNLPLAGIVATYEGRITIPEVRIDTIGVPIAIAIPAGNSGDTIALTIPAGIFLSVPITVSCTVTSDSEEYSFSSERKAVTIQEMGDINITVENSSVTKAGKADFKIKVELPEGVPPGVPLNVTFAGQKK